MAIYRISPTSLPNGDFAMAWFDDERCLWSDDRLHKPGALAPVWQCPTLRLFRPERGATAVLFNPNAYAFAPALRDRLSFPGVEFLAVEVIDHGRFWIPHAVVGTAIPPGSQLRRAPESEGNVVDFFSFAPEYVPERPFFALLQPRDSAAGRAGYFCRALFVNDEGADAIRSVTDLFSFNPVGGA